MNALPSQLSIVPFTRPVSGTVTLPGSKSLTNRALLLAALCDAPVTLTGALFSEDTELMTAALRALGLTITADRAAWERQSPDWHDGACRRFSRENANQEIGVPIHISGQQNLFQSAIRNPQSAIHLNVGLAGTAARFLTALCAAAPRGIYRIDGVPQMRKRPMRGLLDALRSLGADIRCLGEEHHFPIEIHARGLRGGAVTIDASESSQMLSALLMISPLAAAPLDIRLTAPVREPFVQMTKNLMAHFGWSGTGSQSVTGCQSGTGCQPVGLEVARAASPCDDAPASPPNHGQAARATQTHGLAARATQPYHSPNTYAIEPDATAASYYLALPLVTGGSLTLNALRAPAPDSLQGDIHFATILQHHGLHLQETATGLIASASQPARQRPIVSSEATGSTNRVPSEATSSSKIENFSSFSDTFLTLAAIAPLLPAPTRITGIAHTRKQETDRVSGMARELTRLGQRVIETEDTLEIHPRPLKPNQLIDTRNDHRFAMSFAILGCHDLRSDGRPWLTIDNPACCAKTFPNFFELLDAIRAIKPEP